MVPIYLLFGPSSYSDCYVNCSGNHCNDQSIKLIRTLPLHLIGLPFLILKFQSPASVPKGKDLVIPLFKHPEHFGLSALMGSGPFERDILLYFRGDVGLRYVVGYSIGPRPRVRKRLAGKLTCNFHLWQALSACHPFESIVLHSKSMHVCHPLTLLIIKLTLE